MSNSVDWSDQSREDEIHVMMIDPHNLDIVRGELEHLVLSGGSISSGYETDTRISASLQTEGSNYISNSWLRIIHKFDGYENELGTFIVTKKPTWKEKNGLKLYSYELQSTLWGLSKDQCINHFAIGSGAYSLDVFDRVCSTCGKAYIHNAPNNHRYSSSEVYEACTKYLSILFDICGDSTNRLDVDGHGRITISKYTCPSQIIPSWDIIDDDPRTLFLSSSVKNDSDSSSIPSRVIVVYKNGDTEIIASKDLDASSEFSSSQRGYSIAESYNVTDLSPATQAGAEALAQKNLKGFSLSTELSAEFLYFPCKCGETMYLTIAGEKKKYLITNIDCSLSNMNLSLTLKEV